MTYKYVHHSGRYDRTPAKLVEGFHNDVARGADIIAFTEIDAEPRYDALRTAARTAGWGIYRPNETMDDAAIAYKRSLFSQKNGWGKILTQKKAYSTSGHLLKPFAGTFLVLYVLRRVSHTLVGGVGKTPSHVDT